MAQQDDDVPVEHTDPVASDVLYQQGTNPNEVEPTDREALQQDLRDQGSKSADESGSASDIPDIDDAADDRNTSDGQLISS